MPAVNDERDKLVLYLRFHCKITEKIYICAEEERLNSPGKEDTPIKVTGGARRTF